MKKWTLFLLFCSLGFAGFSTSWVVTAPGFVFSPATITIQEGDSVFFEIAGIHTVVEVAESTWNNNNNTPLAGGFSLPNGGGLLLPAKLTPGTHWYVCGPHANMGMKGIIIVEAATATEDPVAGLGLDLLPNPTTGKFQILWEGAQSGTTYRVDINDMNGQVVNTRMVTGEQFLTRYAEFNLADLPKGTYVVRIYDKDAVLSRKVVLQ